MWHRLVPAVLFLAGAGTVGLVGFGNDGRHTPLRPGVSEPLELSTTGDPVVIAARQSSETNAQLAALEPDHPGEVEDGVSVILMEVTAYCPCQKCCGPRARGITASGRTVDHNDGLFVAADTRLLPFGTRIQVPGYGGDEGAVVEVVDRGGAIKGYRLDVFYPDHQQAKEWGRQVLPVRVYNVDGRRAG